MYIYCDYFIVWGSCVVFLYLYCWVDVDVCVCLYGWLVYVLVVSVVFGKVGLLWFWLVFVFGYLRLDWFVVLLGDSYCCCVLLCWLFCCCCWWWRKVLWVCVLYWFCWLGWGDDRRFLCGCVWLVLADCCWLNWFWGLVFVGNLERIVICGFVVVLCWCRRVVLFGCYVVWCGILVEWLGRVRFVYWVGWCVYYLVIAGLDWDDC